MKKALLTLVFSLSALFSEGNYDYHQIGLYHLNRGGNSDGVFYLQKAISLKGENLRVLTDLGYAHTRTREFKKAFESFEKALLLSSSDTLLLTYLGSLYLEMQDYDNAQVCLSAVVTNQPDYLPARLMLASVVYGKKDYSSALELLSRCSDMTNEPYYYNLSGLCKKNTGLSADAVSDFEKSISLDGNADAIANRSICLWSANKTEESAEGLMQMAALRIASEIKLSKAEAAFVKAISNSLMKPSKTAPDKKELLSKWAQAGYFIDRPGIYQNPLQADLSSLVFEQPNSQLIHIQLENTSRDDEFKRNAKSLIAPGGGGKFNGSGMQ